MSFTLIVPPAVEPVALDAVKSRLRISSSEFDQRLGHLITAARERVEQETGLALITQTWLEWRDSWLGDGRLTAFATRFRMLKPPLQTVEKITLFSADHSGPDWDPAQYLVDNSSVPGRIVVAPGGRFPEPERSAAGIKIRFIAGYGDDPSDVPAPLAVAVELLAASLFENGGSSDLPPRVSQLIAPWRRLSL